MNSAVQLALMTKAKKVFGAENTFLSFPVTPLPYTKRDLDFFSQRDAADLRESQQNLQEFSTLVNLIPDDETWVPTDSTFLWDVYEQVLKEANFADSSRTPEEEAAYQRALAFLRVPGEGGVPQDSEPVKVYKQYKDAYFVAEQKYNADKLTGETASDPAERQRWRDEEEPEQRANLDRLRAEWVLSGFKNEVEAAQAKVVNLGARSPTLTWNEWNSRFNADIDTLTGLTDTSTVYPTFFSPTNALEDGAWQPFKLTEEEVRVLINEAPADLRARYAAESAAAAGRSLSFEFSSATVQRPWFASDVFRARFWRFSDANRLLSDGGAPPKGPCPAYVTAVVFARKVREEVKQAQPGQPARPVVAKFEGFQFSAAVRDQERLKKVPPQILMRAQARRAALANAQPASEANPATSPRAASTLRMAGGPAMFRAGVVRDHRSQGQPIVRDHRSQPQPQPAVANAAFAHRLNNLSALTFRRPGRLVTAPPVDATPPPKPPEPEVQDDSIYILAFICKTVPKCPDPDPTLQW